MKPICERTELKHWKFTLDQTQYGEGAGWARPEYDDSRWGEVESYTAWETYEYAMNDYEGSGWFRTHFEAKAGGRKVLHFDGVGGVAKVFVNGHYVGGTDSRYLPFDLDISAQTKEGDNLLAILVDNSFQGIHHLPGATTTEWVLYGGLTHRIYLEHQPVERINHVRVDAGEDKKLAVTVMVENRVAGGFKGSVAICVEGLTGCCAEQAVECSKKGETQVVFHLDAPDAKLWDLEQPNLYTLKVVLKKADKEHYTVTERFGFRTVRVEGTKILLNSKEILLKGVNRYDEFAPYGNCAPEEEIRKDLQTIKDLGFNLIRTHYPQDPIHYEIADELGLMYMIEVPLNWWKPKPEETFADYCGLAAEAVDALDRTFENFCNHPCWTIWSIGNECFHSRPAAQDMFRMLAKRMRAYNPGRLITYASNQALLDEKELDFCDFLSMNYYTGILAENEGQFQEQLVTKLREKLQLAQRLYPNVPHVMTEYGYVCVRGIHGSLTEGRFTEDYGTTFLREDIKLFQEDPLMRGLVLWCWADYRHRRGFAGGTSGMHLSATYGPYGLVTMDRKPKEMLVELLSKAMNDWQVEE